MPVDDIVPSREKEQYMARVSAKMQLEAQKAEQQPQQAQATQPDGSPQGGMDGNIVSNRDSGRAG
jgi:hypothetical protein